MKIDAEFHVVRIVSETGQPLFILVSKGPILQEDLLAAKMAIRGEPSEPVPVLEVQDNRISAVLSPLAPISCEVFSSNISRDCDRKGSCAAAAALRKWEAATSDLFGLMPSGVVNEP
jgi:hypothetical protein